MAESEFDIPIVQYTTLLPGSKHKMLIDLLVSMNVDTVVRQGPNEITLLYFNGARATTVTSVPEKE